MLQCQIPQEIIFGRKHVCLYPHSSDLFLIWSFNSCSIRIDLFIQHMFNFWLAECPSFFGGL